MLSLNRYAYAHGNPLANVDPSGHFIEGLLNIVGIVLTAKRWIDAWSVGGRSPDLPFRDGLPVGTSGWTFGGGFGLPREGLGGWTRRGAGWGSTGGLPTVLQGGRFGHSPVALSLRDCLSGSAGDALGRPVAPPRPWWVSVRSALGGTFSSQSGGKFSNAAATAAFEGQLRSRSTRYERRQARRAAHQAMYERGPGLYVTGHRVLGVFPVHLAIEYRGENDEVSTLSAAPDSFFFVVLESNQDRPEDRDPGNNFTVGVIHPPEGVAPGDYFEELRGIDKRYNDAAPYSLFPGLSRGTFNSNSHVRGLIEGTGGRTEVDLDRFYGGSRPLPVRRFLSTDEPP